MALPAEITTLPRLVEKFVQPFSGVRVSDTKPPASSARARQILCWNSSETCSWSSLDSSNHS
jgi:hypothetical protein